MGQIVGELLHVGGVVVDGQHIVTERSQDSCQRRTEAAQADDDDGIAGKAGSYPTRGFSSGK
jgi:hypothetical protein